MIHSLNRLQILSFHSYILIIIYVLLLSAIKIIKNQSKGLEDLKKMLSLY